MSDCPHCAVMTDALRAASKECDEWKAAHAKMWATLEETVAELRSLRTPSTEDSINAVVATADALLTPDPSAGLKLAEATQKALDGLLALKRHWVWAELRHNVEPALALLGAPTGEDRTLTALRGGRL